MVGAADVDVGKSVGQVEELIWNAEVWDWFPHEERFVCARVNDFAFTENGIDEVDAAFWAADEVEASGEEEGSGKGGFIEAKFGGAVFERAIL